MLKSSVTALLLIALASMQSARATNAISAGYVTNLTYKDVYFVFQLQEKGSNSCAPCPRDPVGLYAGGYCWISATAKGEVAMLMAAEVHHLTVRGRVESLTTDCIMYQMSLQNNE